MPFFTETIDKQLSKLDILNQDPLYQLKNKTALLTPYPNYNLQFYQDLFSLKQQDNSFIVFGEDISGYFCLHEHDQTVVYAYMHDEQVCTLFCNQSIDQFITFYTTFLEQVFQCINQTFDDQHNLNIQQLNRFYEKTDKLAMANDEYYWPVKTYELDDGFFPLNESKMNVYKSLLK